LGLANRWDSILILDGGWGDYREGILPKRPCGAIAIPGIGGCEGKGDGKLVVMTMGWWWWWENDNSMIVVRVAL